MGLRLEPANLPRCVSSRKSEIINTSPSQRRFPGCVCVYRIFLTVGAFVPSGLVQLSCTQIPNGDDSRFVFSIRDMQIIQRNANCAV